MKVNTQSILRWEVLNFFGTTSNIYLYVFVIFGISANNNHLIAYTL